MDGVKDSVLDQSEVKNEIYIKDESVEMPSQDNVNGIFDKDMDNCIINTKTEADPLEVRQGTTFHGRAFLGSMLVTMAESQLLLSYRL